MSTRRIFIERALRQIYGEQPHDDSAMTVNLVNNWLNDGIGIAAKKNYADSYQIEGINYVNNGFYTTFKGISITKDERGVYKFTLPQIPVGIGKNEGISMVQFKDTDNNISFTAIPLSMSQLSIQSGMRAIPGKCIYYSEGIYCYVSTNVLLTQYTAIVTMVSGGDSTDLDSVLNIPDDYIPIIVEYIKQQLGFEKVQKKDLINDGNDS